MDCAVNDTDHPFVMTELKKKITTLRMQVIFNSFQNKNKHILKLIFAQQKRKSQNFTAIHMTT